VIAGALPQKIGLSACERALPEVVRHPARSGAALAHAALVTKDERIRRHFRQAIW
jgi:hypothetical protein